MTNEERIAQIKWNIWALNESINHLEDIYHRAKNEDFKQDTRNQITTMENEKRALYKEWEGLRK